MTANAMKPRVLEADAEPGGVTERTGPAPRAMPKVTVTDRTEPIVPVQPTSLPAAPARSPLPGRGISFGLAGLAYVSPAGSPWMLTGGSRLRSSAALRWAGWLQSRSWRGSRVRQ